MLTVPNLQKEFIEYLFERILFERILSCSHQNGCCIDPSALSNKFEFILGYYSHGLRNVHDLRSEAIQNLGLNTVAGIVIHLNNMQGRYKIFPASLESTFDFGCENSEDYENHVQCRAISNKQIKEFNRDFAARVPKEFRDEIELLVNILKANKLIAGKGCGDGYDALSDSEIDSSEGEGQTPEEQYVAKLEEARLQSELRLRKVQSLITSIKSVTSMDVVVLSSSADEVNVSDYDVELLLLKPKPRSSDVVSSVLTTYAGENTTIQPESTKAAFTITMTELSDTLKKAGYKSVQHSYRYADTTCEINVPYTTFYDHRSELTCQITLCHPLGLPLRDLIKTYASLDDRVGRLIYASQQILDEHGRSKKSLSNYAIALMVIAFLQEERILPKLQHHRIAEASSSSIQSTPKSQKQPVQSRQSPLQVPRPETSVISKTKSSQKNSNMRKSKTPKNPAVQSSPILELTVDMIQVQTLAGKTRNIDCRFDRSMAKDESFGNQNKSTVGELLLEFLSCFVLDHDFRADREVSIVEGSLSCPNDSASATRVIGQGLSAGASSLSVKSAITVCNDKASEEFTKIPLRCSKNTSSTDKSDEKPAACATGISDSAISKPEHLYFSRLNVCDPFVRDRNVTKLCTGWKLNSTIECFEKAFGSLDGDISDCSLDALDYLTSDSSDDSSDDERIRGNEDTKGPINEKSNLDNTRLSIVRRKRQVERRRDRHPDLTATTEGLLGGIILLTLAAGPPSRS
ncbi:hypothetical protein BGZ49_001172 [Haplosporangium sp. Z 27]|nr:hypothetical protein BGZ49_001172 [Haplosporangium sp. Z 27]